MNSVKIELTIPEDIVFSMNKNPAEISDELKKLMALEMYNSGKLSLGKCAKLADMNKPDFIKLLSLKGYSLFNWDEEEIESEIDMINKLLKEI